MSIRTYSELISFKTFNERLRYLQTHDSIGEETFGINRYFNQRFYRSPEWKHIRRAVIIRDGGWDLGILGLEILGQGVIHHLNPIGIEDIELGSDRLFDMENLVLCSPETHRMIHYGYSVTEQYAYEERTPNDTCPWKNMGV